MAGNRPQPAGANGRGAGSNNLHLRVLSAAVLAPLTLIAAYFGGWPFVLFWGAAAAVVLWEWCGLMPRRRAGVFEAGVAGLAAATFLVGVGRPGLAVAALCAGAGLAAGIARADCFRSAGGILYSGVLAVAPAVLRADGGYGFAAILVLFGVVWATDIVAYFVGHAAGGPKLAPRISPGKTWSGAAGGAVGAVVTGFALAAAVPGSSPAAVAVLSFLLSVAAQAGDLFESRVKRAVGAKDAGHLIPGHGGLMDRVDGFLAAALAAAIIGVIRGGIEAPARGLLVW